ncbi:MAG: deoxyribose-phosphate aldolase [Dermatophilaceae bacterium]|nr:deoxyribose-phosphate aldolase [Intrasporangiaceae bacterium]
MTDLAARLSYARRTDPAAVAEGWLTREHGRTVFERQQDGRGLLLIAADHPARGALGVRGDAMAMASRSDLLARLGTALSRPGVDGVLASPDILDDLLLLGLLDDRVVFGTMNRGGLQGASFELDDRFTSMDAQTIADLGLDGGKMLTRICHDDAGSVATLEACGRAVTELAARGLVALIEPFITDRVAPDRVENRLDPDSVIRSVHIAAGLGASSAYTWLKLPVVEDMERVLDATTLPTLLLGGDPAGDPIDTYASWGRALDVPQAVGLVIGRALLYPADGDVSAAVDVAAELVHAR